MCRPLGYHFFALCVCLLTASAAFGQERGVFFHQLRHDKGDTLSRVTEFIPDSLAKWEADYGASMFAFPMQYSERLDVATHHAFEFRQAATVFMLVTISGAASGTLTVTDKQGRVLVAQPGTDNSKQHLLEIPAYTFSVRCDHMDESAVVQIDRVFIKPQHEQSTRDFGFDTALPCHINTACTQADPWRDQTRSVVRIRMVMMQGMGWCSGALINNTARDATPYILSAEHCLGDFTPIWSQWRFDFNYHSADCTNPANEPGPNSLTGCQPVSKNRDTDFLLLEIDDAIPPAWDVYFSGWNRTLLFEPDHVALLHHPSGDIKKVTIENQAIQLWGNEINWTEGYATPGGTHFRTRWDVGVFEPGSSGAPVYDTAGLIIGQLHGGTGDCNANFAFSGQFPVSWNYGDDSTGRLLDWLDPLGTDTLTFPGMEHPALSDAYHVTLIVRDPQGRPMKSLELNVTGGISLNLETDSTGKVVIPSLPRSEAISFTPFKNTGHKNGVSAADLFLIKKHLLGEQPFTENWQVLAQDATGNGIGSASDILLLQKLLLGIVSQFPQQSSWIFDPPEITLQDPEESNLTLEFLAIKIGDVNGTVNND